MAKHKTKEKFPKQIYVCREGNPEFLNASESPEGLEVQNGEREIAIYQLVRIAKAVNKTEVV